MAMPRLRLSQGQLNVLTLCPRKFQYLYLDQLASPAAPEQQQRLLWGHQFHLLMQQRELDLPIEAIDSPPGAAYAEIHHCFSSFLHTVPNLFQEQPNQTRHSEYRQTLNFADCLLTVIYDLLLLTPDRAHILDWKTYLEPPPTQQLAIDWQTRLYCFVLTETSQYSPEQVEMTYWFVRTIAADASVPRSAHFPYSAALHEQTRHDLLQLLATLKQWLESYQTGQDLPQSASMGPCTRCPFTRRCSRGSSSAPPQLSEIQERSLL